MSMLLNSYKVLPEGGGEVDLLAGLTALWQNGSLVDLRGSNNLTPSHTDPAPATAWNGTVTDYQFNQLVTDDGYTYRARRYIPANQENIAPSSDYSYTDWTPWEWNAGVLDNGWLNGELCPDEATGIVYRFNGDLGDGSTPPPSANGWIINAPQVVPIYPRWLENAVYSSGTKVQGWDDLFYVAIINDENMLEPSTDPSTWQLLSPQPSIPYAIQFNGVDNYASCLSAEALQLGSSPSWTKQVWVNARGADDNFHIGQKGNEDTSNMADDGTFYFASISASVGVAEGWHHIVATSKGNLYVDGVLDEGALPVPLTVGNSDLTVGCYQGVTNPAFMNAIAQLSMYKGVEWGQAEVSASFNNGNGVLLVV